MRLHRHGLTALALGLAVVAGACGSGDDETSVGAGSTLAPIETAANDGSSVEEDTDNEDTANEDNTTENNTTNDSAAEPSEAPAADETDNAPEAPTIEEAPAPEPVPPEQAAAAAGENIDDLAGNDDVRLIEVLDVNSGQPTTIADAVDGDRPVLLWFWAPH